MARITLDGIAHSYGGKAASEADYALKPLHHVWEQGMAYALLGPSGCGKTTLLNIISGLVIPSEGRLLFDAVDVTHLPTEQRNIAQVFQFPVIYDTMTVAENLAFPLKNRGVAKAAIERRVAEIAEMLDLTRDLNRRARGLTADAKQKISLGRGLVRADVSAVLFDEPLTVIDPALKWELRSKLKAVHRALDLLMIYVTHDQIEALTFADKVVVMNDGKAVQIGTPAELFERPEHTFVGYFIGSPGMNLLPARSRARAHRSKAGEFQLGRRLSDVAERRAHPDRRAARLCHACQRMRACPCRSAGSPISDASGSPMSISAAIQSSPPSRRQCQASATASTSSSIPRTPMSTSTTSVCRGGGMIDKPINNRAWFFVLPVLGFVHVFLDHPRDDRGELLDPGHDGREQFLLERRRLVPRSAESRARKSARDSTTRCSGRSRFSFVALAIEVPLGIAMALCLPRRAGRSGFRW